MLREGVYLFWVGLLKFSLVDRIVFDDVDPSRYFLVERYEFIRILEGIIESFENDVLISNPISRILMKVCE